MNYSQFKSVLVDTNKKLILHDQYDNKSELPFIVFNDLDYIQLNIMMFIGSPQTSPAPSADYSQPIIAAKSVPLRQSTRIADLNKQLLPTKSAPSLSRSPRLMVTSSTTTLSTKIQPPLSMTTTPISPSVNSTSQRQINFQFNSTSSPVITKDIICRIASYYIFLFNAASPRQLAIRKMNILLGNQFTINMSNRLTLQPPVQVMASFLQHQLPPELIFTSIALTGWWLL